MKIYPKFLVLLTSLLATGGSLYFSMIMKLEVCYICRYIEVAMLPILAIAVVGIVRRDEKFHLYVLPLAVVGLVLSTLLILTVDTVSEVKFAGFITIPLMALVAFAIILVNSLIMLKNGVDYDS